MKPGNLRVKFIALWSLLQLARIWLAASLPIFVDEAFYAWEGRFPAWAYSDLPGLTAFLTRLGTGLAGPEPLALRAPFLVIGAALPWLVVRVARRWFGEENAWRSGLLCLLLPLGGLLGVLAMPDVSLVLAALLCLDAIGSLRERIDKRGLLELAVALAIGALSHYRFLLVIAAGLAGLCCDRRGRELLRDGRIWIALLAGMLAWTPLLAWNFGNSGAGLRFQFVDRNPWTFHADAIAWIPIQLLLVTPALFVLLLTTLREALRRRRDAMQPWGLLAGIAAVSVLGYFVLGFFADDERVSFHWPLAGWLALIVAAPEVLRRWTPAGRAAVYGGAAAGLLLALAFLAVASVPDWRGAIAGSRLYPADFAGWQDIARHVGKLPASDRERIVASDFELGAQLAFALDRPDIVVLDSPLNRKHGRAAQLQAWGLQFDREHGHAALPLLLVVDDSATPMKRRLEAYHRLCSQFGTLPVAQVLNVDRGRKRYLVYRLVDDDPRRGCAMPSLAWIDAPVRDATVAPVFDVSGWAFKDGSGLARVEVTLDGRPIAEADYGMPMPNVTNYWKISNDPNQPRVGFRARVDASALAPGTHWLGLVMHGSDGSLEPWPEQRIVIERP